jgi:hypothetical protein
MARKKLWKYENLQRAITKKLRSAECRSLCTALRIIERSMHTKFEVHPTYTDWVNCSGQALGEADDTDAEKFSNPYMSPF